jgi:hypothetical protein
MSQLTKDNYVIVEFSHNSCFIKDQLTKEILSHGTLTNGLYTRHISSAAPHFVHVTASSPNLWHSKSVYFSPSLITSLSLSKNNNITASSLDRNPCIDCNKAKAHKFSFFSFSHAISPLQVIHINL